MRAPLYLPSLLLATLAVGVLAGCKGNSIEGKWNASGELLPAGSSAVYELSGGRAKVDLKVGVAQIGEARVAITGTYKLEGDRLTVDPGDIKIDDSKLNPMARAFIQSPQGKEGLAKSLAENQEYTVKFDSSDQILLTGKQGTMTLNRVK